MREATFEELTSIDKYIDSISEKAGTKTFEYIEATSIGDYALSAGGMYSSGVTNKVDTYGSKEESLYDKMKHSLEELYDEYTIEVIQGMINKALKEIEEESKSE